MPTTNLLPTISFPGSHLADTSDWQGYSIRWKSLGWVWRCLHSQYCSLCFAPCSKSQIRNGSNQTGCSCHTIKWFILFLIPSLENTLWKTIRYSNYLLLYFQNQVLFNWPKHFCNSFLWLRTAIIPNTIHSYIC